MTRTLMTTMCLLTALGGCGAAKEKAIESAMERIWNDGDLAVIDEAYTPELAHEVRRFVQENRDLYPDIEIEIGDVVIKGDTWVTVWAATGTHRDLNRKVRLEGVSVRKRADGRFVEEAMFYDMKSVFDQLGFQVTPPEGTGPYGAVPIAAAPPVEEPEPEEPTDPAEEGEEGEEGKEVEAPRE